MELAGAGAAVAGAQVGSYFGPVGTLVGAAAGFALGGLLGGRVHSPNPERFASALTALACLRGDTAACNAPRALFTSAYWQRRYPESARKWSSFYATGRAPWSQQWVLQQIGYQAKRYRIPVSQGISLGRARLSGAGSVSRGYGGVYAL